MGNGVVREFDRVILGILAAWSMTSRILVNRKVRLLRGSPISVS
jgi:hypothetical protein